MLLSQTVKIKWHSRNIKYYISKGYQYTSKGKEFEVKVEHLLPQSSVKILLQCDYCRKEYAKVFGDYIIAKEKQLIDKDCCVKCRKYKTKESNIVKYGVENVFMLEEIKEKIFDTNIEKYGFKSFTQTDEYKIKTKNKHIQNYGVEHPMLDENFKLRIVNTCMDKYGVENVFYLEEVKYKVRESLYQNGTAPCSTQQRFVHKIIGGELNYPIKTLSLDIAFPEEMIYLECDFSGHNLSVLKGNITQVEFDNKERRRRYILKKLNWREIRLISVKDRLPSNETLIEMIQLAKNYLNKGHSWFCFDIDNGTVKCSQYEKEFDYGKLTRNKKGSNPS